MTDRPILFSAPMVLALLDGRKTQTRRILKPQPIFGYTPDVTASEGIRFRKGDRLWVRETFSGPHDYDTEKWPPRAWFKGDAIYYWADGNPPHGDWTRPKPGIHMPRWASRLTLTVTDVRVERLQAISEANCLAEGAPESRQIRRGLGAPLDGIMVAEPDQPHVWMTPRNWYRCLWDRINGAGAWDANPWIAALTFTVERRNIDAGAAR